MVKQSLAVIGTLMSSYGTLIVGKKSAPSPDILRRFVVLASVVIGKSSPPVAVIKQSRFGSLKQGDCFIPSQAIRVGLQPLMPLPLVPMDKYWLVGVMTKRLNCGIRKQEKQLLLFPGIPRV